MHIAFYAPLKPPDHPVPSGDRRMARLLMMALEMAGYRVELVSRLRSYDGHGDEARQNDIRRQADAETERIVTDFAARPAADRPALWFTYHLYYKAPDWIGPAVCAATGLPYVVAEASHAPKRASGPWAASHRAVEAALAGAALVLALTRPDMVCLQPLVRPGRLAHLPPFIDERPYAAAEPRAARRRQIAARHGLDEDVPWLLAVGMMRPGDKLESYRRLGAALGHLADRRWSLVVVGDGEARAAVESALRPLGGDRVVWTGSLPPETLAAYYAAADIYVWPAAGEAYGIALLEAQAAGLPVVAGRVRGVPDVTRDGETALLAAENDAADFAAQVRRLLDDRDLRRSMSAAARHFVAGDRGLATAARRLGDLLAPLTAAGGVA